MRARRPWRELTAAAGLVLSVACGGGDSGRSTAGGGEEVSQDLVIARVGKYEITADFLDRRLRLQYPEMWESLAPATEQSIRELLRVDLDHLCLVSEAERRGFDKQSEDYKVAAELSRRQTLEKQFTLDVLHAEVEPSLEVVRAEYERTKSQFQTPPRRVAEHILLRTRGEAEAALARIQAGRPFGAVAGEASVDESSRNVGGNLGYVEKGKPIRGLGDVPELVDAIFDMTEGEIRIVESSRGVHVVRLLTALEGGYRPFDEVKDRIFDILQGQRSAAHLDTTLRALRVRYDARVNDENLARYLASRRKEPEEEIFTRAQRATDPRERLEIYREFLRRFPQSEHACEAQFMIGFTLAEELNDRNRAREALKTFLDACPGHPLAESARYLFDDLTRVKKDT
jgi:hypothetical protein